ncbi:MAG: tetratricopeptide repeat protein [Deltaproteobacteria bacterium]
MKKFVLFFLISIYYILLYGQNTDIENIAKNKAIFNYYDSLVWETIYKNPEEAIVYSKKCIIIANQIPAKKYKFVAWQNLSNCFFNLNQLDSAEFFLEKILNNISDKKDSIFYYKASGALSNILFLKSEVDKSIEIDLILLKYFQTKNKYEDIMSTLNNLGAKNQFKGEYEKSISYFLQSLSFEKDKEFGQNAGVIYLNIGENFGELKNPEKAIYYFEKSHKIFKKLKQNTQLTKICNNLGQYYLNTENFKAAEKSLNEALFYNKEKNESDLGFTYFLLGKLYYRKGDYKRALELIQKSIKIDKNLKNNSRLTDSNIVLADINSSLKRYEEAKSIYENVIPQFIGSSKRNSIIELKIRRILYELKKINREDLVKMLNEYLQLTDSIDIQANFRVVSEKEIKYQTKLKEAENQTLKAEKSLQKAKLSSQNKMLLGGGIGLGVISLLSLLLYRQSHKRKLMNETLIQQKDKIQLLNRELNHRVKNNLAFITSLLEMQGRRTESAETKQALIESESRLKALALVHSQLFRSDTDTEVNLKNYLEEIMEHLLGIFSIPGKALNIETDFCDYAINAEDAMRLGLIVNELVTNSVKHAFTDIENPQIIISTNINSEGKLTLNYSDNGPGISKTMGDKIKESSLGIKLIDLLKKQLGDRYVVVV